jgi:chromosome segregation ATPase
MYLMAMQDLMVSPFRCVDEINQGLDERNERLVFRRIVKSSTAKPKFENDPSSHCGQYILCTPKLLPNLTDTSIVLVLAKTDVEIFENSRKRK